MRKTSAKEIEAVLQLDGPDRFQRFVKRVADDECAWSLWKDGWGLMADSAETLVFPLWPAREYAELCRLGEWSDYEARSIGLDELLADYLPRMSERGVLPAVFPTPANKGVTLTVEELTAALRKELEQYDA
jgi:hypothetical protein